MALIVQKFGGTSVGSLERIKNVARRVAKARDAGNDVVVVVSAMAGETDRLLKLVKELSPMPDPRELDVVVSTGEQVSVALLSMALLDMGCKARSFLGFQVPMQTDEAFSKARIVRIPNGPIHQALHEGVIPVVAGFQGVTKGGWITTLGRGGSDTTAVALGCAIAADVVEIYTDVDGVYTTDPNICPKAKKLAKVSYEEMLEMASLGAKVLQTRCVEFGMNYGMPIHVRSSFNDEEGTWIMKEDESMEREHVTGITCDRKEAKVTLKKVPDRPGIAAAILGPAAERAINVDMIVQNVSTEGFTDFSFTVNRSDLPRAKELIEPVARQVGAETVETADSIAKVSIVGVGMRSHAGIAKKVFETLAKEGINIQMISTSEIKISVVIDDRYTELAVRALHDAFELDKEP
ncbi:MAG: aspartate kinase [Nitrospirota bacterium]|nr:aspartate kinase [Nitrospirota bacterium]